MIRLRVLAVVVVAALAGAGLGACERPPLPVASAMIEGPYRLDTGDELRVVVFEQASLTNLYEINQSGYISMPLIGDVAVRGSTTEEIAGRIAGRLGAAFLRDPNVSVEVAAYRPFFALGEVSNPGQYAYLPGMTAETAIAVAGGFTDRANLRVVRVSRTIDEKLYEGRIAVTEPIRPGDTIYVYERLF